ncbi:HAMP domain-containing histidine kinase [Rhizobium straminoryzae]|uniref:histidine kinase n=1 Tax=Rhizobium straminoryzae TaxID=1387186 RepID=A0A549T6M4_9HYPH|nr:HAMP domain-containing histidine kinase [Rhizobium straminoryzae]
MGSRAIQVLDHLGGRWLQQLGDREVAHATDRTALRLLMLGALTALVLVPSVLSMIASPAIALPLGVSLVLVCLLSVSAAAVTLSRTGRTDTVECNSADLAFDACPGLVLLCDPQGMIQRTGGRERDLLPSSLRDREGLALAEIAHVSDRIAVLQALDALRQGAASASVDLRIEQGFTVQGGRQFLGVRVELSAVADQSGELRQVFVQIRDITQEQCLRDEVEACAAEVRAANEAKSRFLAAVSHELRTPLNAILGFSDVLAGEYFGRLESERQKEYVGLIRQSGAHLLSVVNTMLDMSRLEAGRYALVTEPFRIGDAVEACRAMLDLQARNKGVTLTTRVTRGLADLNADRRAVQQILINLACNAIKFTPAGGVVTIDAVAAESGVTLIVSDTGIGIAADKLSLVGQPFMQVDDAYNRAYEGTGLGLALVKGLVALHGGQFQIESRLGEGTVVTVTLPAAGQEAEALTPDASEPLEFPPRLAHLAMGSVTSRQGLAHDGAKAKIA